MIKVLIVDDSAVVRHTLSEILNSDPDIEVVGVAADPYWAVEQLRQIKPDVMTLDLEMPRMDGLTFLRKLMSQHPIPVVICSSIVDTGDTQIRALEYGAVDIIAKPVMGTKQFLHDSRNRIIESIKGAAAARVFKLNIVSDGIRPKLKADVILEKGNISLKHTTEKVIAIGSSTGGTTAIQRLLSAMPSDCPAIAIVQHMTEGFTRSFANRLDQLCDIRVKEAENGDMLLRGHALVAPGNKHMLIRRSGARYYVELRDGPLVTRHRPSVDVLFRSAARYVGHNAIGVILTGMGDDGANGMKEMLDSGAMTLGQDEATSVVYGMPREAYIRGAVMKQLPLDQMAAEIMQAAR